MENFTSTPQEIKDLLERNYCITALEKLHDNADLNDIHCRRYWIRMFKSWALPPTIEQLNEIYHLLKGLTILDIGCGSGLWSAILKSQGLKVIATDNKSEGEDCENYDYCRKKFDEYIFVEKLDARDAFAKYGTHSDVLFCSWGRGFITENDFKKFKGRYVISIGEGHGGCTDNGYVDKLRKDPEWKVLKEISIPQWKWSHDWLVIYERL